MSADRFPRLDDLPLPLAERVDQVCVRFEAVRRLGQSPQIESYLAEVTEADRRLLLRTLLYELLVLELQLRQEDGERPTRDDYVRRFPDQAAVVDAVFDNPEFISIPTPKDRPLPEPGDTITLRTPEMRRILGGRF